MTQSESLRRAAQLFANTNDPLSQIRSIILQNGGIWDDKLAERSSELFEIHLFGIRGVGLGARKATEDWLKNVELIDSKQKSFSQEIACAAE